MDTKTCNVCAVVKDLSSYYRSSRAPDGLFASCRSCCQERSYKWKREHPEIISRLQKEYQRKNRVKLQITRRKKNNENWEGYIHRRRELETQRKLKRYGGIIDKLKTYQDNSCIICEKEFTTTDRIDIDHDHQTGLIRGLLCRKCNSGLHYLEDGKYMKRATDYLQNPPASKFPPAKY